MRRASIDLGTNTCLLLVVEWDSDQKQVTQILGDYSTVVRLGQGVDKRRKLAPEAMERTRECLKRYSKICKDLDVDPADALCVATSQARDAEDASVFFAQISEETGFQFRTISGGDEARFTFLGGLLPGMIPQNSVVIDIGGGSTEFMSIGSGQSLDIGSVRYTERFLVSDPVQDSEFWECQEAIDQQLVALTGWRSILPDEAQLVAVAGTATTLAAWQEGLPRFDARRIDGLVLTRGDVHRMVRELKWRNVEERKQLPGVEPLRADVLLAGAMILWRAMELLNFPQVTISTRGLRYGVLLS